MPSSSINVIANGKFHSFWWLILPFCIYIPHLYPFICGWTSGLFPYFGNCGHCCYKHWDAYAPSNHCLCVLWDKYLAVQFLGCRVVLFLTFWGTSILLSRVAEPVCIPTNSVRETCSSLKINLKNNITPSSPLLLLLENTHTFYPTIDRLFKRNIYTSSSDFHYSVHYLSLTSLTMHAWSPFHSLIPIHLYRTPTMCQTCWEYNHESER